MKPKKLAFSAIFICFAAALSALETMLPPIVPVAGIRVGMGNIVILFVLYIGGCWRAWDALIVTALRCVLAALIVGSPMSAIYGLSGGLMAWLAMLCGKRLFPKRIENDTRVPDEQYLPFTAIMGAISHIAGQMAVAVAFYGSKYVLAYIPILLASAILGGLFTGSLTMLLLKKLPKSLKFGIRNANSDNDKGRKL